MQNFKLIEIFLEDVGLYRTNAVNVSKHKYLSVILYLSMSIILTGIPILHLKTVPELANGCFGCITFITITGVNAGLISQASNFYKFIDETRDLIQKRMERPDLKFTYQKLSQRNEKFVKLMQLGLIGNCLSPTIALLVYKLFIYFTRGLESDDYSLLIPIWLPFDWKTSLLTYLIAFALEILTIFLTAKVGCPIMCIMVESFLILSEFSKDIRRGIKALNENWKMNKNQVELMQKLSEIVWFNTRLNECIKRLNQIFEPVTIFNLVWSLFSICDSFLLFHFELSKETRSNGVIAVSIAALTLSFGLVFLITEVGDQLNTRSSEINDAICELDWNTFPLRVQRMMPMILVTAQHPVQVTAFGGIPCSRNTFKKIVNTSYSFFNVFSA